MSHTLSFQLARSISSTIYYSLQGVRAIYEEGENQQGALVVNGRLLTIDDIPKNFTIQTEEGKEIAYQQVTGNRTIKTLNLKTAETIITFQQLSLKTGWDVHP